jgi:S-formylglutathione hydrolase FrmB
MGGYGAVKIALKHPDLFASVSSLSGALIPIHESDLPRYGWVARLTLKRVFGKHPDERTIAANDAWDLLHATRFSTPPFAAHLRAGTEDFYGLDGVAAQYGTLMNEHGIPTEVVLEPGGHEWEYWRRALVAIAEWHAKRFRMMRNGLRGGDEHQRNAADPVRHRRDAALGRPGGT